jgi:hypothetical protein
VTTGIGGKGASANVGKLQAAHPHSFMLHAAVGLLAGLLRENELIAMGQLPAEPANKPAEHFTRSSLLYFQHGLDAIAHL